MNRYKYLYKTPVMFYRKNKKEEKNSKRVQAQYLCLKNVYLMFITVCLLPYYIYLI